MFTSKYKTSARGLRLSDAGRQTINEMDALPKLDNTDLKDGFDPSAGFAYNMGRQAAELAINGFSQPPTATDRVGAVISNIAAEFGENADLFEAGCAAQLAQYETHERNHHQMRQTQIGVA